MDTLRQGKNLWKVCPPIEFVGVGQRAEVVRVIHLPLFIYVVAASGEQVKNALHRSRRQYRTVGLADFSVNGVEEKMRDGNAAPLMVNPACRLRQS